MPTLPPTGRPVAAGADDVTSVPLPSHPPAGAPRPRRSLKRLAYESFLRTVGRQRYQELHALRWLATRAELSTPLPLGFKLQAWRQGFHARNAALYDPAGLAAGEYLTDYARHHRCEHLNPIPAIFSQKLILRRILADRGFAQPETLAMISRREIIDDPLGDARRVSAAELEARLLAEGGRYIVKPQVGAFGAAVVLLEVEGGRLVVRRGRTARPFSLARDARPVSLIERAVEQHPFWHELSPYSVNTLRVLVLWTPGDPAPFIARVIQRVGTLDTLPTDNWSGGSVCARVDLETGTIGPGRISPDELDGRPERPYTHHPDTGVPITGRVLPHWAAVKETVLAATRSIPYVNYVGWDVAVDASGTAVFIEGNHNTGIRMLQVHGGLLADPAVRRFYEVCGVLS